MVELFANSADPDQMPCSAASDLGLHCLPVILLGVSRLQWVIGEISSSIHGGLIMVSGQEANSDNLGKCFDFVHNNCLLSVLIRIALIMSTHNIQLHDKIRKFPQIFVLLSYRKNFVGTQKQVWISHGKLAIGVRATEVWLYSWKSSICPQLWTSWREILHPSLSSSSFSCQQDKYLS